MLANPSFTIPTHVNMADHFPLANLDVLKQVAPLPGRSSIFPLVHLAVSATTLFDAGAPEGMGYEEWQNFMYENREAPMGQNHGYALVRGLLDVNTLSPDPVKYPLVRVDLVTNMKRRPYLRVSNSIMAHGFDRYIDNLSLRTITRIDEGEDVEPNVEAVVNAVKCSEATFYLGSKIRFAEALVAQGIGAAQLVRHGKIRPYDALQRRVYIDDGDGTLWNGNADQVYEKKFAETGDYLQAVHAFNQHVWANRENPDVIGPAFAFSRGRILLGALFETRQNRKQSPIYNALVTARGHYGAPQASMFCDVYGLNYNQEACRAGLSKNPFLSGAQLFVENTGKVLDQAVVMPHEAIPQALALIPPGFKKAV